MPNRHVNVGDRLGRGVAVLPGGTGTVARRLDAGARRIWAVPILADDDAEQSATPLGHADRPFDRLGPKIWTSGSSGSPPRAFGLIESTARTSSASSPLPATSPPRRSCAAA